MSGTINPIYGKSVLVEYRNTAEKFDLGSDPSATAFFYEHGHSVYLVTNEHAVVDKQGEPIDKIDLHLFDSPEVGDTTQISVNLLDDGSPIWYGHRVADLAIVPLEIDLQQYGHTSYSQADILPRGAVAQDHKMVSGGDSAIVIGYPLGFTDENKLPVIREALISTPYQISFSGDPCFLIDARMHDGMSGSPVLSDSISVSPSFDDDALLSNEASVTGDMVVGGGSRRYLLGIHSGPVFSWSAAAEDNSIISDDSSEDMRALADRIKALESYIDSQLELNQIWYADLIHRILSEKEPVS